MTNLSLNARAALLSVLILFVGLAVWELSIPAQQAVGELTEYEKLTGAGAPRAGVPPPSQVI
ncbi:MAG: nitrate ABC transporter, permease protein, partial [Alphaproteobacteria bacterium]|nr:nitrate ABC transporter, permease protein [Alphaproteobacteria bacterium]